MKYLTKLILLKCYMLLCHAQTLQHPPHHNELITPLFLISQGLAHLDLNVSHVYFLILLVSGSVLLLYCTNFSFYWNLSPLQSDSTPISSFQAPVASLWNLAQCSAYSLNMFMGISTNTTAIFPTQGGTEWVFIQKGTEMALTADVLAYHKICDCLFQRI